MNKMNTNLLSTLIDAEVVKMGKLIAAEKVTRKAQSQAAIKLMWAVGHALIKIHDRVSGMKKNCIKRFVHRIDKSENYGYLAMQLAERFDKKQFKLMCKHALSTKVVKSLCSIRDASLRQDMLQKACSGYSAKQIRLALGAPKRKTNDKKYAVLVEYKNGRMKMLPDTFDYYEDAAAFAVFSETNGKLRNPVNMHIVEILIKDLLTFPVDLTDVA